MYYRLADSNIPINEQWKYIEEGQKLSEKNKYNLGIAQAKFWKSFKNNVTGNWALGLEQALEGIEFSKKAQNKIYEALFYSMVSMSYEKQNDLKNMYIWSKKITDGIDNKEFKDTLTSDWAASMSISGYFTSINQLDSALYYADRSYQAAKRNNLPLKFYAYCFNAYGRALAKQKKYKDALTYYLRSIDHLQPEQFSINEVDVLISKLFVDSMD